MGIDPDQTEISYSARIWCDPPVFLYALIAFEEEVY